jgi:hypothetical protein
MMNTLKSLNHTQWECKHLIARISHPDGLDTAQVCLEQVCIKPKSVKQDSLTRPVR